MSQPLPSGGAAHEVAVSKRSSARDSLWSPRRPIPLPLQRWLTELTVPPQATSAMTPSAMASDAKNLHQRRSSVVHPGVATHTANRAATPEVLPIRRQRSRLYRSCVATRAGTAKTDWR